MFTSSKRILTSFYPKSIFCTLRFKKALSIVLVTSALHCYALFACLANFVIKKENRPHKKAPLIEGILDMTIEFKKNLFDFCHKSLFCEFWIESGIMPVNFTFLGSVTIQITIKQAWGEVWSYALHYHYFMSLGIKLSFT